MPAEHEHTFIEEREPSGRLIAIPCLQCGLSAFDALVQAKNEMAEDKLRIKDLIFWADKYEAELDRVEAIVNAAQHVWDKGMIHITDDTDQDACNQLKDALLAAQKERI